MSPVVCYHPSILAQSLDFQTSLLPTDVLDIRWLLQEWSWPTFRWEERWMRSQRWSHQVFHQRRKKFIQKWNSRVQKKPRTEKVTGANGPVSRVAPGSIQQPPESKQSPTNSRAFANKAKPYPHTVGAKILSALWSVYSIFTSQHWGPNTLRQEKSYQSVKKPFLLFRFPY